jgi:hypothetical protein
MKPTVDKPSTNYQQYVQLRTMMDSVAIGSLRYYLDSQTEAEQERRFRYLEKHFMAIVKTVWARKRGGAGGDEGCPDGYYSCDGCCVPYQCFGSIGD